MAKRGAPEVRIGIAGSRGFDLVAQGCAAQANARVVAVADPDLERARAVATGFGIDKIYADPREMIDAGGVDAVHFLSDAESRTDVVLAACRARKHVALHKPLATTVEDARAIREAADLAGVTVLVVDPLLHFPPTAQARALLAEERVGEVQMIRIKSNAGGRGGWGPGLDPARLGDPAYNPLLTPAFEKVAVAEFLFGPIREVFAYGGPAARMVSFKFAAPARYGLHEAVYSEGLLVPSPGYSVDESIEISGLDGYLWLRNPMARMVEAPRLMLKRKDTVTIWDDKTAHAFPAVVAAACGHFLACVRAGATPLCGIREAERAVRVNVAAHESARTGKPVPITE